MSRYASGVRVMRVQGESKVVAFTRAEHDENADVQKVEQPAEAELAKEEAEALEMEKNEVIVDEPVPDDGDEE